MSTVTQSQVLSSLAGEIGVIISNFDDLLGEVRAPARAINRLDTIQRLFEEASVIADNDSGVVTSAVQEKIDEAEAELLDLVTATGVGFAFPFFMFGNGPSLVDDCTCSSQ